MSALLKRSVDGRYTILRPLGEGGMGTVFLAADTHRESARVALKLIPRDLLAGASVRYFRNEFRALAGMRHPGLTEVFDFGATRDGQHLYFTAEFVDGPDILAASEACRSARDSDEAQRAFARLYDWIAQIARALEYVHDRGYVHFDVKPANILIARSPLGGPGTVKLLDFGLSSERAAALRPGLRGSMPYMAPEVIRGDPVDRRADLYSLGATLYEIVTGRPPFDPPSDRELERMHLEAEPLPPRTLSALVPPPLEKAILRLLRKDPSERYATATELVRALRAFGGRPFEADFNAGIAPQLLRASLVGREEERQALFEELAAADAGRGPRLVALRGPPGIGKSRLASEARHRAQLREAACAVVEVRPERSARSTARAALEALEAAGPLAAGVRGRAAALREEVAAAGTAAPAPPWVLERRTGPLAPVPLAERTAEVLTLAARDRTIALFIESLEQANPDAAAFLARLFLALATRRVPKRILVVVTARDGALPGPLDATLEEVGARTLALGPLGGPEVLRFVESALGLGAGRGGPRVRAAARAVEAKVGGNPLAIERALDAIARAGAVTCRDGRFDVDPEAAERAIAAAGSGAAALARALDGLDADAAVAAERLAVLAGRTDLKLLHAVARLPYHRLVQAIERLRMRDLVELRRPEGRPAYVSFRHESVRQALQERLDPAKAREVNDAAVAALERRAAGRGGRRAGRRIVRGLARLARHALAGSDRAKALRYALDAADRARDAYANETALALYTRALDAAPPEDAPLRARILEEIGRLDELAGRTLAAKERYLAALAAAERIPAESAPLVRGRLFARLGWALATLRDLVGARRNLHVALRTLPREERARRAQAIGRLGWIASLSPRNRTAAALRLMRRALRELKGTAPTGGVEPEAAAARLFLETAMANVRDRRGELDEAEAGHRRALAIARSLRDLVYAIGALANLGRIARARGDLRRAARLLEGALRRARRAGLADAEAQILANLGTLDWSRGHHAAAGRRFAAARAIFRTTGNADMETMAMSNVAYALERRGAYAEALAQHAAAVERCRRANRRGAELEAELGLASTSLLAGDTEAAARALDRAAALLQEAGTPALEAEVLEGQARLRRAEGKLDEALAAADRAHELRRTLPPSLTKSVAALERAELLAERGEAARALAAWREAREEAAPHRSRQLAALAAFVRGRIALAEPRAALAIRWFLRAIGACPEHEDMELAWRACRGLGMAYAASGDRGLSDGYFDRAGRILREIEDKLPPGFEDRFRARPGVRELIVRRPAAGGGAGRPDTAGGGGCEGLMETVLEMNAAITRERDRKHLFDRLLDAGIRLAGAERGFIMLALRGGKLKLVAGRSVTREHIRARNAISRTIVERAIATGEPVLLADAARDPSYRSSASVVGLRLASVLCVPLRSEARTIGALYVDHRFQCGAFGASHVRALTAIADQAAIAIENLRLYRAAERARAEVEELARRLEEKVDRQDKELVAMRRTLESAAADPDLGRRYEGLIGSSRAMVELFRVLDRVTDSPLPVLIQGESGTGKELVARAIHLNGPRRARPFVVENCSAIPEPLLEAELFGAKKGAYSGSVSDRPGLFDVANGGTLFLDEVGDMSLAMQSKLLRALERGEVRAVGASRPQRVDVRIIAATNKDLRAEIEGGRFREDLFYRLNVLTVNTPPLRDRTEDIPLLVEHFLDRIARARKEAKKTLGVGVMEALLAYGWPGNVRELMHEVERAAQLSDATIGLDALSPQVRGTARDAVSLATIDHRTIEIALRTAERRVIIAALDKTGGNRTRAAKLLGISRFGLQKRMIRCGLM